jgi:3-oxoacyl-[acyl-carrier-protein] synthase III
MYVKDFEYVVGDPLIESIDRSKFMTGQYINILNPFFDRLDVGENVAFLYAAGPAMHHSDVRNIKNLSLPGNAPIKSQIGLNVFTISKMINNVNYASSNSNTCASSIYSLHEAKMLLDSGYTDVVVYSDELREPTQELLFKQLGIDMVCTDGAAIIHLSNKYSNYKIDLTSWKWNADSSPMSVSADGYIKVLNDLYSDDVSYVKTHGTGTERNNEVEASSIELFGIRDTVSYKEIHGHTQGASGLIELCMLIEDKRYDNKTGLVLASGLGGFYGGVRLTK